MTLERLTLCPPPQKLSTKPGTYLLENHKIIQIETNQAHACLFSAQVFQNVLLQTRQKKWSLHAGKNLPENEVGLKLTIQEGRFTDPQAYQLIINPDRITLTASHAAGVFYGIQTLCQIIKQGTYKGLPCCVIEDYPDFPVRGIMLDISRDKVPKMKTLFMLIDEFANMKINQLQLYTEHTFAYLGHEIVWQKSSPMRPEQILVLDQYCRERFIELVPNQNSFGHMTRWLKHPEYQHLAETTQPVKTPWGTTFTKPFSLAATQPESLSFIRGLYDQLLQNFSSQMVNVGCDETFDLGTGKSSQACQERGKGRVYLDYLMRLYRDLKSRGKVMQFWGDILLQYPDLVPSLPKDSIALDWGYEADHPFDAETRLFHQAGIPFYVCPGTSSWNSLGGRTNNALKNIKNAAVNGLANGAIGILTTDWGDNGHWQQLPISHLGFFMGASYGWNVKDSPSMDPAGILSKLIFLDHKQQVGKILMQIGNEYETWGLNLPNSSPLFWLLQKPASKIRKFRINDINRIRLTQSRLQDALNTLRQCQLDRQDADLMIKEISLTILLMQHACKRAYWILASHSKTPPQQLLHEINSLKDEYKLIWMERNRMGGIDDSMAHFDVILREYETR